MVSAQGLIQSTELREKAEELRPLLVRHWPEFAVGRPVRLTEVARETTTGLAWTPRELLRVVAAMRDSGEVELIEAPEKWTPSYRDSHEACIRTNSGRWILGFRLACSVWGPAEKQMQAPTPAGREATSGGRA